ncbi:MAG: hypothetical protein WCE54_13365 [Ignavibacteriaceae bacterium]
MSEDIFTEILNKEPSLSYIGFENTNGEGFEKNREKLAKCFEEFKICCEWIEKHQTKIRRRDLKNYNYLKYHYNSYFLTHSIERWSGTTISSGAFIAALIYFEISYKHIFGTPDISVYLALSKETPYI